MIATAVIIFLWLKSWKKETVWVTHGRLMFTWFHIFELQKVPLVPMKKDQTSSIAQEWEPTRDSGEVKQVN